MKIFATVAVAAGVAVGIAVGPPPRRALSESTPDTLVAGQEAAALVSVADVKTRGGSVSGVLVSQSHQSLRDVELLIRYVWLWNDERHPGEDNPGRSAYYTVPDLIPPGASAPFHYEPSPPLPKRSDGHFEISVEVVGFTEVGR